MLSIKQSQKKIDKKDKNRLNKELPYFITFVTLLTTSGFGPYTVLQKIKNIEILPAVKLQSERILNRIEILGIDPISAINQVKEKTSSRSMADFLGGYVAAIEGGGDVASYLKSKMEGLLNYMLKLKNKV